MKIEPGETLPWTRSRVNPLYRALIPFALLCAVFAIRAQPPPQDALMVRFQSATRGEILTHYADGNLAVEGASDFTSGKWWTGTISAKAADLDLENPNYGSFTTEPGTFAATLSCKGTGNCVSKQGKWTQIKCDADICNTKLPPSGTQDSIDVWCDSLAACQSFVKSLKDAQAPKG